MRGAFVLQSSQASPGHLLGGILGDDAALIQLLLPLGGRLDPSVTPPPHGLSRGKRARSTSSDVSDTYGRIRWANDSRLPT